MDALIFWLVIIVIAIAAVYWWDNSRKPPGILPPPNHHPPAMPVPGHDPNVLFRGPNGDPLFKKPINKPSPVVGPTKPPYVPPPHGPQTDNFKPINQVEGKICRSTLMPIASCPCPEHNHH